MRVPLQESTNIMTYLCMEAQNKMRVIFILFLVVILFLENILIYHLFHGSTEEEKKELGEIEDHRGAQC